MSERKTAEIKFRCTPTFKAGLQAAADAAGESLSAYIESSVWARHNTEIDGTKLLPQMREAFGLEPESEQALALEHSVPTITEGTVVANGLVSMGDIVRDDNTGEIVKVVAKTCACRPWEFCTHKGAA